MIATLFVIGCAIIVYCGWRFDRYSKVRWRGGNPSQPGMYERCYDWDDLNYPYDSPFDYWDGEQWHIDAPSGSVTANDRPWRKIR